ncbi:protein of unknown function [Xenorhabdus poinarii G6]|uniref:Uncharacterized protein n=1 Tax=Xenorhabdus poinarii G6 TaxID=1354304 RepID=A0A068R370_9GAMM|nr:protein of unknown function [Xenorhabdus poinarii G6]
MILMAPFNDITFTPYYHYLNIEKYVGNQLDKYRVIFLILV